MEHDIEFQKHKLFKYMRIAHSRHCWTTKYLLSSFNIGLSLRPKPIKSGQIILHPFCIFEYLFNKFNIILRYK